MPAITLLVVLIPALAGAVFMAYIFRQMRRSPVPGAVVGAVAGAAGSLIVMLPLNFCTFEAERTGLDVAFGLGLIVIGTSGVLWLVRWLARVLLNKMPQSVIQVQQSAQGTYAGTLTPWLLLLPTLLVLALFLYYPSLDTFRLSTLLAKLGARRTAFVCLDNFTSLVTDQTYLNSLLITFGISLAIVVIGMSLALLIATMAHQPIKGASIYRTLLIWPYAISPVVAGIIFLLLFNPAGGIINYFLSGVGLPKIPWLNDPTAAPWAVIIASVWKSMGFNILFYIAGLQNVPKDLQEAAAIDGANALQRFWNVVIPLLSPITFFLIITNMTYAFFETFGTIDYLTGGGPLNSTTTLMYRIYEVGIQNNDLGKAAAQSIVLFLMVIGLTVVQFRSAGQRVNYGA
jgi:sn-glycerol 3-phosphate transport system permease protein